MDCRDGSNDYSQNIMIDAMDDKERARVKREFFALHSEKYRLLVRLFVRVALKPFELLGYRVSGSSD